MEEEIKEISSATVPAAAAARISTEQKLTKVTLKQDHTHASDKYKAGDEIAVNDADAKWLRENKVI